MNIEGAPQEKKQASNKEALQEIFQRMEEKHPELKKKDGESTVDLEPKITLEEMFRKKAKGMRRDAARLAARSKQIPESNA